MGYRGLYTVHLVMDTIFLAKIPQGVVCCHYRKSFIWIVFVLFLAQIRVPRLSSESLAGSEVTEVDDLASARGRC